MALVYPLNRTDYLGQIHFLSLEETTTEEASAAQKQSDSNRKSSAFGFGADVISSLMGDNPLFSPQFGESGPVPTGERAVLHLPQGITIADKADYSTANLGMIGAAVEAGMAAPAGSTPNISSFLDNFKGSGGKELSKLAVAKTVGAFSEEAGAAITSQAKVTTNPNSRALFNSVPLRSFTFSFKMIPTSAFESRNIQEIITFFRRELYPEEILANLADIGEISVGYRFPNRFGIKMYYGQGDNVREVGTRIQPAYLTDMQTVYNSSTMGMHYDGNFSEIDMTLTFLESKALSRKDVIAEGFEEGILDENGEFVG